MNSLNNSQKLALIAAVVSALAVFLPWYEASGSSSAMGYSADFSSGSFSGLQIGGGITGLVFALLGAYLVFRSNKIAFIFGVVNFFIGIAYVFGILGNTASSISYSIGEASAKFSQTPQMGAYLFTIASIVFTIFALLGNKTIAVPHSPEGTK
ncbi:MAG: hypothetical protein IT216_14075 [Saprospiraceae bacterium]|nr:hypothetical protein [Saprospiraceae bacterium]